MKIYVLIIFTALLGLSCAQNISNLNEESKSCAILYEIINISPCAADKISEIFEEKKIIFLSEKHSDVAPILFLAENIKLFYDAGVRYLFLEGKLPPLPDSENYSFMMFFPWQQAGWKYESVILSESIRSLNTSLSEDDKLQVIFAEDGYESAPAMKPEEIPDKINGRDEYAFSRIISFMENSSVEDKAIVFYGGSHGKIEIQEDHVFGASPKFNWKTLGVYLSDYYSDDFMSIDFRNFLSDKEWNRCFLEEKWNTLGEMTKFLYPEDFNDIFIDSDNFYYNALVFTRDPVYGIYYQYIPTDENLRYIFSIMGWLDMNIDSILHEKNTAKIFGLLQYFKCIYYLKLYFGDHFNYSLWNPEVNLQEAIKDLEQYAFLEDQNPSEKITINLISNTLLHEYHGLLKESTIESFLETHNPLYLQFIIKNASLAQKIFPEDIWPTYWLAYALTEKGEYQAALEVWEEIFANPLSLCMETLPVMYQLAKECSINLGFSDEAELYSVKAANLINEHDINLEDIPFMYLQY
jgi:hypothetical protein